MWTSKLFHFLMHYYGVQIKGFDRTDSNASSAFCLSLSLSHSTSNNPRYKQERIDIAVKTVDTYKFFIMRSERKKRSSELAYNNDEKAKKKNRDIYIRRQRSAAVNTTALCVNYYSGKNSRKYKGKFI